MDNCSTLVLDLDGTLSDPSLGICRCVNHALAVHKLPQVSDEAVRREIGPPLDEMFIRLAPGLDPAKLTGLVAAYRERYARLGYSENTLYPDIPAVLEQLRAGGLPLGLCTSKRVDFAHAILELFGLSKYFDFVSGGDIGVPKGDQLALLLRAASIDGNAVMVGDRAVDVHAAQHNGLRSIGVLWGFGDQAELRGAGADQILREPAELAEAVVGIAAKTAVDSAAQGVEIGER
jgi:phosphoglycolate phosphatase